MRYAFARRLFRRWTNHDYLPMTSSRALRIWYFLRIPNIGDRVNPQLISHIAKIPTRYCTDGNAARLFAIGSILDSSNTNTVVWGTGLMDADRIPTRITEKNIFALRGKLTHSRLKAAGIAVSDVALGDPGYLVPNLFQGDLGTRFRLGFIPHYLDRQHPIFLRLVQEEGVLDVDVRLTPDLFFRTLRSCDAIASSSLHGLIFAEAMGIPNIWVKLSDRVFRTGFKFHDWFSLAAKPQLRPYVPAIHETAAEFASRAVLHDFRIDSSSLAASFPKSRIEELRSRRRKLISVKKCREKALPIFIISYNRGNYLRKIIRSYRELDQEVDIVIHDNGSDDLHTLSILKSLEKEGILVRYNHKIFDPDELNNVNKTINEYFSHWSEPSRYVVTDGDIDMSVARNSALRVYEDLLNRHADAACVGPMLCIRDIPKTYPLYNKVLNRHISQFWRHQPEWTNTDLGRVATLSCQIDTTFAVHRAGEPFARLKKARRVYYPFEARHLDWYLDDMHKETASYYETSSPLISHWNNKAADYKAGNEQVMFGSYFYVDDNGDGDLVEREFKIN